MMCQLSSVKSNGTVLPVKFNISHTVNLTGSLYAYIYYLNKYMSTLCVNQKLTSNMSTQVLMPIP